VFLWSDRVSEMRLGVFVPGRCRVGQSRSLVSGSVRSVQCLCAALSGWVSDVLQ
jgi:hypothetical protein